VPFAAGSGVVAVEAGNAAGMATDPARFIRAWVSLRLMALWDVFDHGDPTYLDNLCYDDFIRSKQTKGSNMSNETIKTTFPEATNDQVTAIQNQAGFYDQDWCTANGLRKIQRWDEPELTDGQIAVGFQYNTEYALPATDGTGLEVTIFAADGSVVGSQDFG
jgi:hypothetical protein